MQQPGRSVVIFDLGGVLIDWNPRYLYRRLFNGDLAAMEHFLAHVCTPDWNREQDRGRTFAEAEAGLIALHPDKEELITAWLRHFNEMILGPIAGTVEILHELHAHGTRLFALTNWSAETFRIASPRFDFLKLFEGIVVSGEEGLLKPDPGIYRLLLDRHGVSADQAVFIDDVAYNAAGATAMGIHGIVFTTPKQLRRDLAALCLL